MLSAGEPWPDFVRDSEIHDHDRAAKDQMEMCGDPRSVVDHRVHAITHVDQPTEASEAQHDEGKSGSEHGGAVPRQC